MFLSPYFTHPWGPIVAKMSKHYPSNKSLPKHIKLVMKVHHKDFHSHLDDIWNVNYNKWNIFFLPSLFSFIVSKWDFQKFTPTVWFFSNQTSCGGCQWLPLVTEKPLLIEVNRQISDTCVCTHTSSVQTSNLFAFSPEPGKCDY